MLILPYTIIYCKFHRKNRSAIYKAVFGKKSIGLRLANLKVSLSASSICIVLRPRCFCSLKSVPSRFQPLKCRIRCNYLKNSKPSPESLENADEKTAKSVTIYPLIKKNGFLLQFVLLCALEKDVFGVVSSEIQVCLVLYLINRQRDYSIFGSLANIYVQYIKNTETDFSVSVFLELVAGLSSPAIESSTGAFSQSRH